MTPADWFLVAIGGWLLTWVLLEARLTRQQKRRDKYWQVNQ